MEKKPAKVVYVNIFIKQKRIELVIEFGGIHFRYFIFYSDATTTTDEFSRKRSRSRPGNGNGFVLYTN